MLALFFMYFLSSDGTFTESVYMEVYSVYFGSSVNLKPASLAAARQLFVVGRIVK